MSSSSGQNAPPPSDRRGNNNDDDGHDGHNTTNPNGNAGDVQPAISPSDDAIDDTEDLSNHDADGLKRRSCERRRPQRGCIQDLLPFPYSPLIRPLTISDLDSCVALENAAFANPAHRCSRDKFIYRLTACPELCMGVFCTVAPSKTQEWDIETLHTAHVVETGRDDAAVSVLLAHVVATRSHDNVVTDDSMAYPQGSNITNTTEESRIGHQRFGRTVCIHSLAVHPKLQGVGMGKLILKSYLQQVKQADIADRVALICREYLINYYKRWGFLHDGPSQAKLANGGWHDMILDLNSSVAEPGSHGLSEYEPSPADHEG